VKKLINAITYGRRKQSTKFFEEANIPVQQHHKIITTYADAIKEIAYQIICRPDIQAAEDRNPTVRDERKIRFSAMSDLMERIEAQKTSGVIARLVTHWGLDPKGMIPMHDGVMCSFKRLHPEKETPLSSSLLSAPPELF
jgi:hypothetical protein